MTRRSPWLGVWVGVLYVFLWAPLFVVVLYSFNSARLGAEWRGFTLEWYGALWRNEAALAAAWNTLRLAVTSTVIATVLGTLLGHGLGRLKFRGRAWVTGLVRIPVVVPDVVLAVSLLLLFGVLHRWTGWFEPGLTTMVLGHVTFQVPFVALIVCARTAGLDPALEEAASDLGAAPRQAFWHVTLPLLRPAVVAGALLAFTLSLDDFAVSFFTSGPGSTTLPILIYSSARRGITPDIHALSAILVIATTLSVLSARIFRRGPA